jgi:hypothetical protein
VDSSPRKSSTVSTKSTIAQTKSGTTTKDYSQEWVASLALQDLRASITGKSGKVPELREYSASLIPYIFGKSSVGNIRP